MALLDNRCRVIVRSDLLLFCPQKPPGSWYLLRNNLFFAPPPLPPTQCSNHAYKSLVFWAFSSSMSLQKPSFCEIDLQRLKVKLQLFDKLITTKLRSSPVFDASRWFPSGYRACRERESGSYFQTGPDVMTGPNLNTGKSVQICQKRWAVSCKQLRVGNERESNLKPTQGPNISFGFASGFFKQSHL